MSVFSERFPLSESIGIFFGISGVDWLANGYAEPLKAAIIALCCGFLMFAWRCYRHKADRADRKPATKR